MVFTLFTLTQNSDQGRRARREGRKIQTRKKVKLSFLGKKDSMLKTPMTLSENSQN